MTRSSLYFRIINIFLEKNILIYINFILVIFVLTSLSYDYEVVALDETIIDKFPNRSSEKFIHNNDSIIINYPNSNITNLTNNKEDSIYGQIAAFENDVYVVWQESVIESFPEHNYDIFFIKSEDKGKTFSMPINLSNNTEFSERPQMAVSKTGIFIVWTDTIKTNNKQIMFTKSEDNGTTFSKVISLSNNSQNSNNQEISAFNENVYVVWRESDQNNTDSDNNNSIIFKSSPDSGNTFNNSIELIKNTNDTFPKINSYGNNVYIVWNNENKKNGGLFFIKSSDKGSNFDKILKLGDYSDSGESQIAVDENEVLVVWGGFLAKNISNIYYVKSNNDGNTFTDSKTISDKIIGSINTKDYNKLNDIIKNPMNVETINDNNLSYVVWQNTFSKQNADILLLLNNQKDNKYITKLLNLSNNTSFSECPSIAISNNNVYIIWEDFISGNHEILFANIPIEI
ncbi:MAG TPA: sialidase family protein [Nitrososphaeraceae archaeon]|nr:sialidase family protein [Nitrososphaeraceae archaeon]